MEEKEKKNENQERTQYTPDQMIDEVKQGVMKLSKPIRSRSQDVEELKYDFSKLTGREYVEALDSDVRPVNAFRVSAVQALNLFAKAVEKATPGLDAIDVRDGMDAMDAAAAVNMTMVFFNACNRAGSRRITKE